MAKLDTEHRDKISSTHFAFPKQRKEPLEDLLGSAKEKARGDAGLKYCKRPFAELVAKMGIR